MQINRTGKFLVNQLKKTWPQPGKSHVAVSCKRRIGAPALDRRAQDDRVLLNKPLRQHDH
jgi:hypothetical protein